MGRSADGLPGPLEGPLGVPVASPPLLGSHGRCSRECPPAATPPPPLATALPKLSDEMRLGDPCGTGIRARCSAGGARAWGVHVHFFAWATRPWRLGVRPACHGRRAGPACAWRRAAATRGPALSRLGVRRAAPPDRWRDVVGEKTIQGLKVANHLHLGHGGNCSALQTGLCSTWSTGQVGSM